MSAAFQESASIHCHTSWRMPAPNWNGTQPRPTNRTQENWTRATILMKIKSHNKETQTLHFTWSTERIIHALSLQAGTTSFTLPPSELEFLYRDTKPMRWDYNTKVMFVNSNDLFTLKNWYSTDFSMAASLPLQNEQILGVDQNFCMQTHRNYFKVKNNFSQDFGVKYLHGISESTKKCPLLHVK